MYGQGVLTDTHTLFEWRCPCHHPLPAGEIIGMTRTWQCAYCHRTQAQASDLQKQMDASARRLAAEAAFRRHAPAAALPVAAAPVLPAVPSSAAALPAVVPFASRRGRAKGNVCLKREVIVIDSSSDEDDDVSRKRRRS